MRYWLMKSEPSEFSIDDLAKRRREPWTGVRNFMARNYMRDAMRIGDRIVFYHSSCAVPGAAGIARVASSAYPDPTQFDKRSAYFDPRATKNGPVWYLVDVAFVGRFSRIVTRQTLGKSPLLRNMQLWRYPRLSIVSLTAREFRAILRIASHNRSSRSYRSRSYPP